MGGGLVALVKYGKNAEYRENIIKCDNDFEKIIKFMKRDEKQSLKQNKKNKLDFYLSYFYEVWKTTKNHWYNDIFENITKILNDVNINFEFKYNKLFFYCGKCNLEIKNLSCKKCKINNKQNNILKIIIDEIIL